MTITAKEIYNEITSLEEELSEVIQANDKLWYLINNCQEAYQKYQQDADNFYQELSGKFKNKNTPYELTISKYPFWLGLDVGAEATGARSALEWLKAHIEIRARTIKG